MGPEAWILEIALETQESRPGLSLTSKHENQPSDEIRKTPHHCHRHLYGET